MITVFTPAYNRAYRLPVLYRSLLRQTDFRFEWIVVDDGSQDNTGELVDSWIREKPPFPVRYFRQENSGKHAAVNCGTANARSDWFFIVDSDDYLTEDAVARIHAWIATVDREDIAGVSGTKCHENRKLIGACGIRPGQYLDAKNNERKKYRLQGDKAEVYRTQILRQYPFPVFPGETFLPEGAVWDAIALAGYKIRWFPHPITVCAYLEDGLSAQLRHSDIEVRNFQGCTYYTNIQLQAYRGLERIKIICRYINKGRRKGLRSQEIGENIQTSRMLVRLLTVPVILKNQIRKLRRSFRGARSAGGC